VPYFTELPPVILPRAFAINWPPYHWCELQQVRDLVQPLSEYAGTHYDPSSEDLVNDFAALIPYNRQVIHDQQPKIFRCVVSPPRGTVTQWGTEVPKGHHPYFEHKKFVLDVGVPYPNSLFVPMDWSLATLTAILAGATCATERKVKNTAGVLELRYVGIGKERMIDISERQFTK
jgi:hypothetical protein